MTNTDGLHTDHSKETHINFRNSSQKEVEKKDENKTTDIVKFDLPKKETPAPEKTEKKFEDNVNLFDIVSRKTEKDVSNDKKVKQIETGEVDDDEDLEVSESEDIETDSPTESAELTNSRLMAKLTIASVNVGMGMLLQMISGDWSEEGEKRFSLSPTRKSELLEPLEMVLETRKTKMNPMVVLVITIIITYIPMLVQAFRWKREERKKIQAELRERELEQNLSHDEAEETILPINRTKQASENKIAIAEKLKKNAQKIIDDKIKAIKKKKGRRSNADAKYLLEHDK